MKNFINALALPLAGLLLAGMAAQSSAQDLDGIPGVGDGRGQVSDSQGETPIDISGNWVSVVTEDWRLRMVGGFRGEYDGLPLNARARELADAWDPQQDVMNGDECKAYGVGGIMRMPTRLRVEWENDNVLRIDTDSGSQTRLIRFAEAQDGSGAGTLQGVSNARFTFERQGGPNSPIESGTMVVETTNMAPGYMRRNGVPYSENMQLTEYFDIVHDRDGTEYLVVLTVLDDPDYFNRRIITSSNFKRDDNPERWNPTECLVPVL